MTFSNYELQEPVAVPRGPGSHPNLIRVFSIRVTQQVQEAPLIQAASRRISGLVVLDRVTPADAVSFLRRGGGIKVK